MKYSKTLVNEEIDKYIDILEDLMMEKLDTNKYKNSHIPFDKLINIYLDEIVKDGLIDALFPSKKTHILLANKWRQPQPNNVFQGGGCPTCQSGGCKSCNMEKNPHSSSSYDKNTLKYMICDKMYCFSFKNNNNFPIAKMANKMIYINKMNHNNSCEGKMIRGSNFELIPNLNQKRDCIYISAASGSGKTYFAKEYIKKYKKIYPNRKIYLFSKKTKDESIDDINPIRIKIDESFIEDEEKLDYSIFKNSLVVFDDVEQLGDDKIRKEVMKIGKQILNLGRDSQVSIIMISHMTLGGSLTKNILTECNVIVLFPNSGSFYQYIQYLKIYLGIPNKEARKILKVDSRWLTIFRECPMTFMTEKKIYMNVMD